MKETSASEEEETKRQWVLNISKRELKKNEISLLRNGLNFAVTPRQIPIRDILALVESAIHHLLYERQDIIRREVYSALRQAKPPRVRNLAREEQEALRTVVPIANAHICSASRVRPARSVCAMVRK